MRWIVGPQVSYAVTKSAPTPAATPAADAAAVAPAKRDPEVSAVLVNDQFTASWPGYDSSTHNKVVEVRAYAVSSGAVPPGDANGFLGGSLPYAGRDVSGLDQTSPGSTTFPMPPLDDGLYVVFTVIGFDA